jgi:aspartyl-tRNA(Asn)/glutamyl-tRNA(Gln) amidotransferase subunit C
MNIDVSHTAKLANLPLTNSEKKVFAKQLDEILEYIERLKEVDTSKVEGTNEVNNLKNVWREDEVKPSLSQERALMNAKRTYNGFFVVPAIMEEAVT